MKTITAGIRMRRRKGVKGIDWASYLRPRHRNRMTHWLPYPREPSAAPHRGMDSAKSFHPHQSHPRGIGVRGSV